MAVCPSEGISPNNDGINDLWENRGCVPGSAGLEQYLNPQADIFNRSAQLIYHSNNYCNNWDGRNNQHQLIVTGSYAYTLKLGSSGPTVNGNVVILY